MIERVIPFEIRRIFYLNSRNHFLHADQRKESTKQAVICLKGSCLVTSVTGNEAQTFVLDTANQCLLLAPEDRYQRYDFTDDSILMVLASEPFEQLIEQQHYEVSVA